MIPYGRQDITDADIDAVVEVLKSDYLTQGPKVPAFEQALGDKVGARHALAMNSATSALHLACLALDLDAGDWLWTSPVTFVASANCGLYCGARVDFVDIDPETYNISPEALEKKLIEAEQQGRLPSVVVAVHLSGQPCDMQAIHALGQRYGFRIIEDASHAIGGKYLEEYIGNGRYSDITVFSFHPVKIITSAEGGMAVTNDSVLFEKMALLRSHGITRDDTSMRSASHGPWYYEQTALGYNYRMTELQAALGLSQLERLDEYVERRHSLARRYNERLAELPLKTPYQTDTGYSAFHLYIVRLDLTRIATDHRTVFEYLREQGIGVNLHYIPVHLQPYYEDLGFAQGDFPEAEAYYREAISLPLYPGLTESDQDEVIRVLTQALSS